MDDSAEGSGFVHLHKDTDSGRSGERNCAEKHASHDESCEKGTGF